MATWKFFIAESSDLSIIKDISNDAREKQLDLSFNRSGSCTFNLPLTQTYFDYTKTNRYCILAQKGNTVVWSGPIWTRQIDFNEEKIGVTAVGWFEILMTRFLTDVVPGRYVDENEGNIVLSNSSPIGLLKIANDKHPTWITAGTNTSTSERTITYEIFQSIGENIINLSDMEDGFDIYMDPLTRELNITDSNSFGDVTSTPFGYNWGPHNIANVVVQENGGELRNAVHVAGGNGVAITAESSASIATNNLYEEIIQLTEVSDENILGAVANAHLALTENPPQSLDISLKAQGSGINELEFFENYTLGDKIAVVINKNIDGYNIQVTQTPRVFGATIVIDEYNTERVTNLRTTYEG